MNITALRERLSALRTDLEAHHEQEGEAVEVRTAGGSWADVIDRLEDLEALLPEHEDGPVALLIGPAPVPLSGGGQYLITVWQDGTGELAWRPDSRATWGPPARLEVAP